MGGFFGWFLVFVAVAAIFNAEKLPALRQLLEEKMKGSMEAAKEGAKIANSKIKKVKTEIENKKNAPASVVPAEENTPEEIDESLKFMKDFIKERVNEDQPTEVQKVAQEKPEVSPQPSETVEKTDDAPSDFEHRD